ncbi:MAG TPA: hypothetical protein ENN30_00605 [Candidatus Woesearchaeota archaeon]|nr:hypothetical protein [Candidatus Woesearchaeota archaeon]
MKTIEEYKQQLLVRKISDGVVIDGLHPGTAFLALKLLKLDYENPDRKQSILPIMHVYSEKFNRWKDMLKLEGGEDLISFVEQQSGYLALISENDVRINCIKDWEIIKKFTPEIPGELEGILNCSNMKCVTNREKNVATLFAISQNGRGYEAKCVFCDNYMDKTQIRKNIA